MDPMQLPPAPEALYGDDRTFCFQSSLWQKNILKQNHRAGEQILQEIIGNVFNGSLTEHNIKIERAIQTY